MAKSKKGKTDNVQSKAEEIVEAVETEAEAVVDDTVSDATDTVEEAVEVVEEVASEDPVEDVVAEDEPVDADGTQVDEPLTEPEPESEIEAEDTVDELIEAVDDALPDEGPTSEPDAASEPQVIRETTIEKKSGFMSTALGGVVAAAIGFGAAQFTDGQLPFMGKPAPNPFEEEARGALTAQGEQLTTLATQVETTKKAVEIIDLTPITNSVAGIEDKIAGTEATLKAIGDELAGFDSRLTAIEKAPLSDAVSPESIAAYERELDALRKSITDQQAALEAQKVEIQSMAADAVEAESNAEEKAKLAASRAALAEVVTLAQTGKPFAAPLGILSGNGVAIPDALSTAAADGVPTLAALTSDFPGLARKALDAARKTATGEDGGGGLAGFLQTQLGARSVTPREGDDPDAVLSRAEAAVKAGDLETATSEIAALPEAAQAELGDWLAQAGMRKDALAAAATLAQELNKQ
ncbi:MAG: mitofilin family membrane protein [Pelagimonas sp.]|uniref:COG4223 family protein n=1 Tax=Pelagimonas sp. TaxID=2073170 RepID=UPI003D6C1655